jgi:hypothetical protein
MATGFIAPTTQRRDERSVILTVDYKKDNDGR